jgi:hypothetical protein
MTYKFSGECYLEIKDNVAEYDDVIIVTEHPNALDDIEFDNNIKKVIEDDERFKNLKVGIYHVYFMGDLIYEKEYCYEFACYEYDVYHNVYYVNFEELK